jgi:glutathione S-transferase
MKRFTLYGSPHSLPTYKVALMLQLSGAPFSFRYVSFQKGMHKTPEFAALSRWGQVPVLLDGERVHLQSAAIVEHLAETLGRFQGPDPAARQATREWLYWDVDVLFPPIFGCYGVQLGQRKLLPISVEPTIADYHRRRAETALSVLDSHLAGRSYLVRAGSLDQPGGLDRKGDGAGGFQGAVLLVGNGECRAVAAHRMGGAQRYPSIAVGEVDGFREGLNPSYALGLFWLLGILSTQVR